MSSRRITATISKASGKKLGNITPRRSKTPIKSGFWEGLPPLSTPLSNFSRRILSLDTSTTKPCTISKVIQDNIPIKLSIINQNSKKLSRPMTVTSSDHVGVSTDWIPSEPIRKTKSSISYQPKQKSLLNLKNNKGNLTSRVKNNQDLFHPNAKANFVAFNDKKSPRNIDIPGSHFVDEVFSVVPENCGSNITSNVMVEPLYEGFNNIKDKFQYEPYKYMRNEDTKKEIKETSLIMKNSVSSCSSSDDSLNIKSSNLSKKLNSPPVQIQCSKDLSEDQFENIILYKKGMKNDYPKFTKIKKFPTPTMYSLKEENPLKTMNETQKFEEQLKEIKEECEKGTEITRSAVSLLKEKYEVIQNESNKLNSNLQIVQENINEFCNQKKEDCSKCKYLEDLLVETRKNLSKMEEFLCEKDDRFQNEIMTHKNEILEWQKYQTDLLTAVRVANDFKIEAECAKEQLLVDNESLRIKVEKLENCIENLTMQLESIKHTSLFRSLQNEKIGNPHVAGDDTIDISRPSPASAASYNNCRFCPSNAFLYKNTNNHPSYH